MIQLIVAMDEQRAIGKGNDLLCYLPDDLKHFKAITSGHTIIMGRKTFDSLPKGALPNRTNIVLSHSVTSIPGATVVDSLEHALRSTTYDQDIFIIGGGSIYEQTLDLCDRLYVTHVKHTFEGADTFFPAIPTEEWREVERTEHAIDEKHPYAFDIVVYERE